MGRTVGDFVVSRLHAWGVERIYGYPGDGINGLMGALQRQQEKVEFVQVRHEEMAAFMACAHSKFSGQVGVCTATSGPGAIHLLNGLYDAKMDHQGVVAVVGQQSRAAIGGDYQQEVDLISLFKDVAHEYVHMCSTPEAARHLVDRAMRIAEAERTVTCIILPSDIQEQPYREPARAHGTVHTGIGSSRPRVLPRVEDLHRAADVLNSGERVAMLVGAGCLGAHDEVMGVAELLGAGVAKTILAKTAIDDDLPYCTGGIGLLGTEPSWNMMTGCDTLLMVGTAFPYSEFLPEEGQARAVQIDISPRMLSLRYPTEVNLVGDARETLSALIPYLDSRGNRAWVEEIENDVWEWWDTLEERAMADANPVNPQRVFWELSPRLPDDVILTCDSGSAANWFMRDLKARPTMKASLSGNLASMGPGVPYAVAAKFCHPDRPVIALVGDGAMQMNGMNELITAAKYWTRWSDPRLVVCVLNNLDLNQVTWEQRVMNGDPEFVASQDIPDVRYGDYAESLGLNGLRVEQPTALADAWDAALSSDRPVVLDVRTDPDVPPLPPHITFEQARNFAASMIKGDPRAVGVIRQTVKDMMGTLVPGR